VATGMTRTATLHGDPAKKSRSISRDATNVTNSVRAQAKRVLPAGSSKGIGDAVSFMVSGYPSPSSSAIASANIAKMDPMTMTVAEESILDPLRIARSARRH